MMRLSPSLVAALSLFALVACDRTAPAPAEPAESAGALVMRTYDVPPAYTAELGAVVNRLLHRGQDTPPAGRAAVGPGGQLVVSAPAGVHPGVEEIVASLRRAPPAPPPAIEVTYWALIGGPSDQPGIPPALEEIKPALDAIQAAEGTQRFELWEKVRVRSASGEDAEVGGRQLRVNHTASVRGDQVLAQIVIRHHRKTGELSTRVKLPAGQLLVLGQAGVDFTIGADVVERAVYYVVRADVVE